MLNKILPIFAIILFCNPAFSFEFEKYKLAEPYPAPNIRFSDATGGIRNLSDYQGKVVLLNFWSTWCVPCVAEMPSLAKLTESMQGRDVVILPLSIDFKGAEAVQKFYETQEITNLPIFIDHKGRAFKEYKLQALPTSLIIDRRGNVTTKILGAVEWDSAEARDYLLGTGR